MPNLTLPKEQPTLRVIPMVYDTNARGDIFGGWLMSQIDIAGATVATIRAKGPVATINVNKLTFEAPLYVGDVVSFYAKVTRVGTKSLNVEIDVFAERNRQLSGEVVKISNAELVYVAISEPGKSRVIPQ